MIITKTDIIGKIRTAIDDILPSATDSFTNDTDAELWQAVWHAVQALLTELPLAMLSPSSLLPLNNNNTPPCIVTNTNGSGCIVLPENFLRFVSLQLSHWHRPVTELIEPGSEEALSQTSKWGRGTPEKPRAMLDYNEDGKQVLRYWTAGKTNRLYVHTVTVLNHIPTATHTSTQITCALKNEAEPIVVYRAAAIFFEGKKEPETAEKFRNL